MAVAEHRVPRGIEKYGVEPIPQELKNVGWRDLFAILSTFNLSPLAYVLGALAATAGGLSPWYAATAMAGGTILAFIPLIYVARAGVNYGLQGQVAMRATFGQWGARGLTSGYRVAASAYWFAAQALACAIGIQALVRSLTGYGLGLIPVSVAVAFAGGFLATVGYDALRYFVRIVLPLTVVSTAVIVVLFMTTDDPAFGLSNVLNSPDHGFNWVGLATFMTVMGGAQLTSVTNIADFCRYTPTRRQMAIGFLTGPMVGQFASSWLGAYSAIAVGASIPFGAAADLTGEEILLVILIVAIVTQTISANVLNVYTGGLSVVNAIPRLGRFWATLAMGVLSVALSALPDFIDDAQQWFTHLGNVAAPLAGVVFVDYVILKRSHIDVVALFDPNGRYRFVRGVNPATLVATALGMAAYYQVPDAWFKLAWGFGVGGGSYFVLAFAQALAVPRLRAGIEPAEAELEEVETGEARPTDVAAGGLERRELVAIYRHVLLTREIEERGRALHAQGKVPGTFPTGRGNEAAAVGTALALGPDDAGTTVERGTGVHVVRGLEPWRIIAEYMGRRDGPARGRDGNIHVAQPESMLVSGASHAGAMVPLAVGMALAFRIRGERRVAVAWFPEEASARGDVHEAMTFAALRRLPVVFVCLNERTGSRPEALAHPVEHVADRAAAYGFEGIAVDGADVLAVYTAARRAVEKAREGGGPTLLECVTHRVEGASQSTAEGANGVPADWTESDPIVRLRRWLSDQVGLTEGEDAAIRDSVQRELNEALRRAEESPFPDPESALEGVYADPGTLDGRATGAGELVAGDGRLSPEHLVATAEAVGDGAGPGISAALDGTGRTGPGQAETPAGAVSPVRP